MSTVWVFDKVEKKDSLCWGEDCMKKPYSFLRKHATNVLNFSEKENVTVNKERAQITSICNVMQLWGKTFAQKFAKCKK